MSKPKIYRDFCPLCGYRFIGDCIDKVMNKIESHIEDGTCERNWRSWSTAIVDIGKGNGRGFYEPY